MNNNKNIFLKLLSVFTAFSFLMNNMAVAEPSAQAYVYSLEQKNMNSVFPNLENLYIPENYGSIIERWIPGKKSSNKLIIHVQDAHCHYEAQHNVARIIETLTREYGIDLVAVEGAVGELDLGRFGNTKNTKLKENAIDIFVKKGIVTGPEYLKITKYNQLPFGIYGIEKGELYVENLISFRHTISNKKEAQFFINKLTNMVERLKNKIYSKELLDFDEQIKLYNKNELSLSKYIDYLYNKYGKINRESYNNLNRVYRSIHLEEEIDFKKVERELLIRRIEKNLPKEDLRKLVKKSLQYKLGKIPSVKYYSYLEQYINKLNQPNQLNLKKYIRLVKLQSKINSKELFSEIDNLEKKIKERLLLNNTQRSLDKLSRKTGILNKLFKLQLTRKDLEYFRNHKDEFTTSSLLSFIRIQAPLNIIKLNPVFNDKNFLKKVDERIVPADLFYKQALLRDKALLQNTLKKMEEDGKDTAVMITGGFHTDGMCRLMREENINYVVIAPNITKQQLDNPYLSLLTDERLLSDKRDMVQHTISVPEYLSPTNELRKILPGLDEIAKGFASDLIKRLARLQPDTPNEEDSIEQIIADIEKEIQTANKMEQANKTYIGILEGIMKNLLAGGTARNQTDHTISDSGDNSPDMRAKGTGEVAHSVENKWIEERHLKEETLFIKDGKVYEIVFEKAGKSKLPKLDEYGNYVLREITDSENKSLAERWTKLWNTLLKGRLLRKALIDNLLDDLGIIEKADREYIKEELIKKRLTLVIIKGHAGLGILGDIFSHAGRSRVQITMGEYLLEQLMQETDESIGNVMQEELKHIIRDIYNQRKGLDRNTGQHHVDLLGKQGEGKGIYHDPIVVQILDNANERANEKHPEIKSTVERQNLDTMENLINTRGNWDEINHIPHGIADEAVKILNIILLGFNYLSNEKKNKMARIFILEILGIYDYTGEGKWYRRAISKGDIEYYKRENGYMSDKDAVERISHDRFLRAMEEITNWFFNRFRYDTEFQKKVFEGLGLNFNDALGKLATRNCSLDEFLDAIEYLLEVFHFLSDQEKNLVKHYISQLDRSPVQWGSTFRTSNPVKTRSLKEKLQKAIKPQIDISPDIRKPSSEEKIRQDLNTGNIFDLEGLKLFIGKPDVVARKNEDGSYILNKKGRKLIVRNYIYESPDTLEKHIFLQIGSRIYEVKKGTNRIDLKELLCDPLLWIGNAELVDFFGEEAIGYYGKRIESSSLMLVEWTEDLRKHIPEPVLTEKKSEIHQLVEHAYSRLADQSIDPLLKTHYSLVAYFFYISYNHTLPISSLNVASNISEQRINEFLFALLGIRDVTVPHIVSVQFIKFYALLRKLCELCDDIEWLTGNPGEQVGEKAQNIVLSRLNIILAQIKDREINEFKSLDEINKKFNELAGEKVDLFSFDPENKMITINLKYISQERRDGLRQREVSVFKKRGPPCTNRDKVIVEALAFLCKTTPDSSLVNRIAVATNGWNQDWITNTVLQGMASNHRIEIDIDEEDFFGNMAFGVGRSGFGLGGASVETETWLRDIFGFFINTIKVMAGYNPKTGKPFIAHQVNFGPNVDKEKDCYGEPLIDAHNYRKFCKALFSETPLTPEILRDILEEINIKDIHVPETNNPEVLLKTLQHIYDVCVEKTKEALKKWIVDNDLRILMFGQVILPNENPVFYPALLGALNEINSESNNKVVTFLRHNYFRDKWKLREGINIRTARKEDSIEIFVESETNAEIFEEYFGFKPTILYEAVHFPEVNLHSNVPFREQIKKQLGENLTERFKRKYRQEAVNNGNDPIDWEEDIIITQPSRIDLNKRPDSTIVLAKNIQILENERAAQEKRLPRKVRVLFLGTTFREGIEGSPGLSGYEKEAYELIKRLAKKRNREDIDIRNQIYFFGYVPQMEALASLTYSHIMSQASDRETFGRTPIEAMASGTPIIYCRDWSYPYDPKDRQVYYDLFGGNFTFALKSGYTNPENGEWISGQIQPETDDGNIPIMHRMIYDTLQDPKRMEIIARMNFLLSRRSMFNLKNLENFMKIRFIAYFNPDGTNLRFKNKSGSRHERSTDWIFEMQTENGMVEEIISQNNAVGQPAKPRESFDPLEKLAKLLALKKEELEKILGRGEEELLPVLCKMLIEDGKIDEDELEVIVKSSEMVMDVFSKVHIDDLPDNIRNNLEEIQKMIAAYIAIKRFEEMQEKRRLPLFMQKLKEKLEVQLDPEMAGGLIDELNNAEGRYLELMIEGIRELFGKDNEADELFEKLRKYKFILAELKQKFNISETEAPNNAEETHNLLTRYMEKRDENSLRMILELIARQILDKGEIQYLFSDEDESIRNSIIKGLDNIISLNELRREMDIEQLQRDKIVSELEEAKNIINFIMGLIKSADTPFYLENGESSVYGGIAEFNEEGTIDTLNENIGKIKDSKKVAELLSYLNRKYILLLKENAEKSLIALYVLKKAEELLDKEFKTEELQWEDNMPLIAEAGALIGTVTNNQNNTYTIQSRGEGAVWLLKQMAKKEKLEILYDGTEEEKEATRAWLLLHGIIVPDERFVTKYPKQYKTAVGLLSGDAKDIPEGHRIIKCTEETDMALASRAAAILGSQEVLEMDYLIEKLKQLYRAYFLSDNEIEEWVQKVILKGGAIIIDLPPMRPFIRAFYDTLELNREIVAQAV